MSTLAFMIGSANILLPDVSFYSKKPFNMAVNIVFIELVDRSGIQIMLKCLNSLGVTAFLPPPGGAQAHTNLVSLICLNMSFLVS